MNAILVAIVAFLFATVFAQDVPFPLPATYATGTNGHLITIEPNGHFTMATQTQCVATPCPEAGGQGEWKWNAHTQRMTLRQNLNPQAQWIVAQTWAFPTMSEDMLNRRVQAKLVATRGVRASEFPVPAAARMWVRVTRGKDA